MLNVRAATAPLVMFCAGALWAAGAEPSTGPVRRYQSSPAFFIRLDQVDPDAVGAVLEVYDWSGNQWRACGDFLLKTEGNRFVEGGITFRAREEGEYLLRSTARDRAGNVELTAGGPDGAEVIAVYDRTPPQVDVVKPDPSAAYEPGSEIVVVWKVRDLHPAAKDCVSVELSADGGSTWSALASLIDDVGEFRFCAPAVEKSMVVRVTAWDLCGNRGEGTSGRFGIRRMLARGAGPPEGTTPRQAARAQTESREVPRVDAETAAHAAERYRLGASALASGRLTEAVTRLREAIGMDPTLESGWLDLSVALARSGELSAAEQVLVAGEKRFPRAAAFAYNRGLVLIRMGKHGEAKVSLTRAVTFEPQHVGAHWTLATLAVEAGDLQVARGHWQEVVRYSAEDSQLRQRALRYLQASEP